MRRQLARRLTRPPGRVFLLGLGWVVGPRFVLMERRERDTGRPARIVLKVAARRPTGVVVVPVEGRDTPWVRDVVADPQVRIWYGYDRGIPARATVLAPRDARIAPDAHPNGRRRTLRSSPPDSAGDPVMVELRFGPRVLGVPQASRRRTVWAFVNSRIPSHANSRP